VKKIKKNKALLAGMIFGLITLGALVLRLNNYEKLVNFYLDPPFFLHEVKDMVDSGKIRLIGPMVATKVIEGRFFFTGPLFYWLLALLGTLLSWEVVLMTAFFTFLWVGTFALIYFWLKRRFSRDISLSAYAILSFLPIFISYSRMIWNTHFIPLFGVLLLWFLEERKKRKLNWFLAGLFFGLGIHVHYSALLWLLILGYYLILELKNKDFTFKNWLLLGVGVVIVESPLILFELRHNFYNFRTIIFQIKNFQLSAGYTFGVLHYYLFPLIPLICKFYGLGLEKLKTLINAKLVIALEIALIGYLLIVSVQSNQELTYYPPHWSLEKQKQVIDLIIEDDEEIFEVATLINSDTRALELRWWLREKGIEPLGVEEYNQAVVLYLVAPESRPPEKETVWEIQSLRPFKIAKQVDLGDGYIFYKLRRLPKNG
jgi:4-amino-4-deoxy-L-arabinose transferase-like glycosyltransferase